MPVEDQNIFAFNGLTSVQYLVSWGYAEYFQFYRPWNVMQNNDLQIIHTRNVKSSGFLVKFLGYLRKGPGFEKNHVTV